MPAFVRYDPQELVGPEHVVFHEARHILVAYRFGFEMRTFSFRWIRGELAGSFGCDVNGRMQADNPRLALISKVVQLLAGEVAARRRFGLATEEVVFPMANNIHINKCLSINTVLGLVAVRDRKHDIAKVLEIARQLGPKNWWTWFWEMHQTTVQTIDNHYEYLEQLAGRLLAAKPFDSSRERLLGTALNFVRHFPGMKNHLHEQGSGQIDGPEMIRVCSNLGIPLGDSRYVPEAQ